MAKKTERQIKQDKDIIARYTIDSRIPLVAADVASLAGYSPAYTKKILVELIKERRVSMYDKGRIKYYFRGWLTWQKIQLEWIT